MVVLSTCCSTHSLYLGPCAAPKKSAKRAKETRKRERREKNDYWRSPAPNHLLTAPHIFLANLTHPPHPFPQKRARTSESGVLTHHGCKEHVQPEITVFCASSVSL